MCFGHGIVTYHTPSNYALPMAKVSLKFMQQETDIKHLSQVQKTLSQNPNASQRELALSTNLSLGMTNALLKRFSDKGWLYMKKISTRNIQYVLTPSGMNELMHRSSRYFKRTARLMKDYKEIICDVIYKSNCENVIIVGNTDLEFLFDFACENAGLSLQKVNVFPSEIDAKTLVVFSDSKEYYSSTSNDTNEKNMICIASLLENHTIEQEEPIWQLG